MQTISTKSRDAIKNMVWEKWRISDHTGWLYTMAVEHASDYVDALVEIEALKAKVAILESKPDAQPFPSVGTCSPDPNTRSYNRNDPSTYGYYCPVCNERLGQDLEGNFTHPDTIPNCSMGIHYRIQAVENALSRLRMNL